MKLDLGLGIPSGPPSGGLKPWMDGLETAINRMAGPFRSLWLTDHFFWGDEPTAEAWTTMAYLAGRWPELEIGSMVLGQGYRNPALLAKMAATLHDLTGGRLIFGLGAGWKEDEYRAYGYPYPPASIRIEQLDEALEIVHRMWSSPVGATFEGKHFQVRNAYCEPRPDPLPTILVGGGGERTLKVAARRADWWNIPDAGIDLYRDRVAALRVACGRVGRDPDSLRLTWYGRLALGRTEAAARRLSGPKWPPTRAFVGTPAQVVAQMQPFLDLGVDYFMLEVLGLPDEEVVDLVLAEWLPGLQ